MLSKRDRINEIIKEVRENVTPTDVIPVTSRAGSNWTAKCPFHGGKSKGHFMVSNIKKIYKCFNCGQAGDVIKFNALDHNINYVESALELALKFNIIYSDEYDKLTKRSISKKEAIGIEKKYAKEDKEKLDNMKKDKADDKILDKVYKIFIQAIELVNGGKLNESHYKYLIGRNLSDEEISNVGYFSFPIRSRKIKEKFLTLLEENGFSKEILMKVPGFYYDDKANEYTFYSKKSIGIPIINECGLITGIQMRFDEVKEGENRYRWFTSQFSEYGCSPGVPVEVIIPDKIKNSTIFVTEGHFKGRRIAKEYGSITISVAGVQSWRMIVKTIINLTTKFRITNIYICFDADMSSNLGVLRPALELGNSLYQQIINKKSEADRLSNMTVEKNNFIVYLVWDEDLGKGIDDFLDNGYTANNNLDKVLLSDMLSYSYNYVKTLIDRNISNYSDIFNETSVPEKEVTVNSINWMTSNYYKVLRDIPKEEMKTLFEDMILNTLPNYNKLQRAM